MGLYLRNDDQRSQVQERVASELQERLKASALKTGDDHESTMLENQHTTRPAGVIIGILIILLCVGLIWFALSISS